MSQSIYIVEAAKGFQWEGESQSVVFTTFDREEAIAFANDYFDKTEKLTLVLQTYDFLSVTVKGSVIGVRNSESIEYRIPSCSTSKEFKVTTAQENSYNRTFAYDLKEGLFADYCYRIANFKTENIEFKPTVGWSLGLADLDTVSVEMADWDHYIDFVMESYNREHLITIEDGMKACADFAISQDAESAENIAEWDLYKKFEQIHYKSKEL